MRADRPKFMLVSILIAASVTGVLWYLFSTHIHGIFFLVLLFWMIHVHDIRSRLREINDRLELQDDALGVLLIDGDYTYDFMLDEHGFHDEADKFYDEDKS
jgi:membrane protein implicated in regulation of membrane protease activity